MTRVWFFFWWVFCGIAINYFFDNNVESWKILFHQTTSIAIFSLCYWYGERIDS